MESSGHGIYTTLQPILYEIWMIGLVGHSPCCGSWVVGSGLGQFTQYAKKQTGRANLQQACSGFTSSVHKMQNTAKWKVMVIIYACTLRNRVRVGL